MSLLRTVSRFSRVEWIALGRLSGLGVLGVVFTGCVATVRPMRPAPVVVAPAPTVVVREAPRAETVVVIREAPPPPRREIIVERERPSPLHVWVAGYWRHDGRAFAWVPGHWDRPPRERAVWVEPRWERRGGSWVFIEGTWR